MNAHIGNLGPLKQNNVVTIKRCTLADLCFRHRWCFMKFSLGSMQHNTSYRADIDGLRAVAVLAVLFFHAGFETFGGGFVGVDVFFVISGFLITSIIQKDLVQNSFSIQKFYQRRIQRIFPALFVIFITTSIAAYFLLLPSDLVSFAKSLRASTFFISNIFFKSNSGYFDAPAEQFPLLHTWSLSVEEQFYIFFPPLLWLLCKRPKVLPRIIIMLTIGSFAWSCWATSHSAKSAFYLLPSRSWELLMGSILAIKNLPDIKQSWIRKVLATTGLIFILVAIFIFSKSTKFPGIAAVLPCLGTVFIIYAGQSGTTWVAQLLSSKPMVFMGLISYSLYLWHWPIFLFGRQLWSETLSFSQILILIFTAMIISVLSWRYIETPFRNLLLKSNRKLFSLTAFAMLLFFGVSLFLQSNNGLEGRLSSEELNLYMASKDFSPMREACHDNESIKITPFAEKCVYGKKSVKPRTAVWGDSFAVEVAFGLGELAEKLGQSVLHISFSSCPPAISGFSQECLRHNQSILQSLEQAESIRNIVLVARYAAYNNEFLESFKSVIKSLNAAHKNIFVIYPIPEPQENVPQQLTRAKMKQKPFNEFYIPKKEYEKQVEKIVEFLNNLEKEEMIISLRPSAILCNSEVCKTEMGGEPLYFDKTHLSMSGIYALKPELVKILE